MRWGESYGIAASLVVAAAGCGVFDAPPALPTEAEPPANILTNAGFESGGPPWIPASIPAGAERAVSLSDAERHGGDRSVELRLDAAVGETGTRAVSSVQGTAPTEFPEFVSGFYRISEWQPNAAFQYVYFSVTVHDGDFGDDAATHEIRFVIGAPIEPALEPNLHYVFLSRNAPVLGAWTYFSYPVGQAFADRFQKAATRWSSIDVAVGVRLDGHVSQDGAASAVVQYDDLYAGPQAANSNRPSEP